MENLTGLGRHYLFRPAGLRDVAVATHFARCGAEDDGRVNVSGQRRVEHLKASLKIQE